MRDTILVLVVSDSLNLFTGSFEPIIPNLNHPYCRKHSDLWPKSASQEHRFPLPPRHSSTLGPQNSN